MSDYERLAAAEGLLPGPGYQEGFEAGYERCKQDATTAIKALDWCECLFFLPDSDETCGVAELVAVVAALGQQQEGVQHPDCQFERISCHWPNCHCPPEQREPCEHDWQTFTGEHIVGEAVVCVRCGRLRLPQEPSPLLDALSRQEPKG